MVDQTIEKIYENYLEDLQKAASNEARRFGGIARLLTGKRSDTEDLVEKFDPELQAELCRMLGQEPDSSKLRELAEWMLKQAVNFRDIPQAKYAFLAALRHLTPYTDFLGSADALDLANRFEAAIPQYERFPVHKELIAKLRERSKAKEYEHI